MKLIHFYSFFGMNSGHLRVVIPAGSSISITLQGEERNSIAKRGSSFKRLNSPAFWIVLKLDRSCKKGKDKAFDFLMLCHPICLNQSRDSIRTTEILHHVFFLTHFLYFFQQVHACQLIYLKHIIISNSTISSVQILQYQRKQLWRYLS